MEDFDATLASLHSAIAQGAWSAVGELAWLLVYMQDTGAAPWSCPE